MNCFNCKQEFKETKYQKSKAKKGKSVFCSKACFRNWLKTERTGKKNPFYGRKHTQKNINKIKKTNTKTGQSLSPQGYIILNRKSGEREKSVPLHRIIIEKVLQRKLCKDEVIHHMDGNRTNNELNNLLVLSRSEHAKVHNKDPHRKTRPKTDEIRYCPMCGKMFLKKHWEKTKFCVQKCYSDALAIIGIKPYRGVSVSEAIKKYYAKELL